MVLRRVIRAESGPCSGFWVCYASHKLPAPSPIAVKTDRVLSDRWSNRDDASDFLFAFQSEHHAALHFRFKPELVKSVAVLPGPDHYIESDFQCVFRKDARVETVPFDTVEPRTLEWCL